MKKHLFLIGPSGCGKTALLREELGEKAAYAGGLITERVFADDGSLMGCELFPAAAAASKAGFDGLRFLDCSVTPPTHDNEVFRGEGVRMLAEAQYYPFVMLDEIGGFELLVPQFRAELAELLNGDAPIIGALKDAESAEALRRLLGIGERFSALTANLRAVLAKDSDTAVVEMSRNDSAAARRAVREWVKEYA